MGNVVSLWAVQREEECRRREVAEEEARALREVEERSVESGLAFLGSAVVGFQRYRDAAALVQVRVSLTSLLVASMRVDEVGGWGAG